MPQPPERPNRKPSANRKETRAAFALRIDRVANDLNPFLIVLVIGLMVLDLTLYLGMAVSREPFIWRTAHQIGSSVTPGVAAPVVADPADPSH